MSGDLLLVSLTVLAAGAYLLRRLLCRDAPGTCGCSACPAGGRGADRRPSPDTPTNPQPA